MVLFKISELPVYSSARIAKLIDVITDFSILYAKRQIEHGIDAFQLFESNAGVLPWSLYCQLCLPSVRRIAAAVRDKGIPFLYFPKGIGTGLVDMTPDVCDFVSVDWQTPSKWRVIWYIIR